MAAGVVLGAWRCQPGDSNAAEWECGLSRSWAGAWAIFAARQSQIVCALTGGAERDATTKGLTGSMKLLKRIAS